MDSEQLLSCALDIGEQMLVCGAEISRVETSIRLICGAYGCRRTDVFTITSSIVVSIEDRDGIHRTQTRRVTDSSTNITRLDRLNSLSRDICANRPDYGYVQQQLRQICQKKAYPLWLEALGGALIAFSFAVFFGGSWTDGAVAGVLGLGLQYTVWLLKMAHMNLTFTNVVASFLLCFAGIGLVRMGIGDDANMIIIGNIMLLIPGIALTNSIRDLISGDSISGLLRFLNAMLGAAAIAAGYILAAQLLGGTV